MNEAFRILPLVALCGVGLVGVTRAVGWYRRGVYVVVVDRQRTVRDKLIDMATLIVLLFWVFVIVAAAWPPLPAWLSPLLTVRLVNAPFLKWVGTGMLAGGVLSYTLGVITLGSSWRMGIDRPQAERIDSAAGQPVPAGGQLITGGIFAWSRNPIYLAFDLLAIGAFLIHGEVVFSMCAILLAVLLHLQILREERFLHGQYARRFEEYCECVGRYGPWR